MCADVCVYERERERERECVCVCYLITFENESLIINLLEEGEKRRFSLLLQKISQFHFEGKGPLKMFIFKGTTLNYQRATATIILILWTFFFQIHTNLISK